MISVVQRVESAAVWVQGAEVARIGHGLLVLVGVVRGDHEPDIIYVARRLVTLRLMDDDQGRMNRSVKESGGELLLVPQFTLAADTRKGRRPSWSDAAAASDARRRFNALVTRLREHLPVACGAFGERMKVELVNDGPVTLVLDSRQHSRALASSLESLQTGASGEWSA